MGRLPTENDIDLSTPLNTSWKIPFPKYYSLVHIAIADIPNILYPSSVTVLDVMIQT